MQAARTLRRSPAFALTAITVLALGIGAPATVFTLVDRIFFWAPPEVSEPDQLVRLYRSWGTGGGGALGHPDVQYYRDGASTLSGLAAWSDGGAVAYSLDGREHDQLELGFVSPDYFDVLGVRAAQGRFFVEAEGREPGAAAVAVVSHAFWRGSLGGIEGTIGRTLYLNGQPYSVIGVAPEGFTGLNPSGRGPDAWVPIAMYGSIQGESDRAWWERIPNLRRNWLQAVGRLDPGVEYEAAAAEIEALGAALDFAGKGEDEGVMVARQVLYNPNTANSLRSLSVMLLAVVGVVLVIAAANVAVLLLARATTRVRELAVHTALGAGRGRVVRHVLVETLLLTVAGGAAGVALAWALSGVAGSLLPVTLAGPFRPGPTVLAAAFGLSLLTALGVGLVPALRASNTDPASVLGEGRSVPSRSRVRDVLVVVQVALSLVLVAAAVLFGRSFDAARSEPVGFETAGVLFVEVDLQARGLEPAEGRAFIANALERLRGVPGVEAVSTTVQIPFQGDWSTELAPDGDAYPNGPADPIFLGLNAVSPGYFDIMGIPLARGRSFGSTDVEEGPGSVIVNEHLASTLWPGEDAVGRFLLVGDMRLEVVGVATDAQYYELGEGPVAQAYLPVQQFYQPWVNVLVRTRGDASSAARPVQSALRELEPMLAFGTVGTLDAILAEETARYRVTATLVGLFGALALLLAAVGLYGVMTFLVAQRTREFGVRMALGADRHRVAGTVLRSGLWLAGAGVALGVLGALAGRRFAESLVFGVEPGDPWVLAGAAVILLAVSTVASLVPARRATRVDPIEAMRVE